MLYYILLGEEKKGPYTVEALLELGATEQSIVMQEGGAEWKIAGSFQDIKEALNKKKCAEYPMPKTWLVESILVTLLCCQVFGAIAIVFSSQVESLYRTGRFDEANKYSERAKTWLIAGFVTGFVLVLFYIGISILKIMLDR